MRIFRNLIALSAGLVLAFFILEIFLRIYNPFPFRLKGDRIVLPSSETYVIPNTLFPQLEDTIIHHKNSLGFRGPEPGTDDRPKMIFVGGSTTECFYLSDGKDWPSRLASKLKPDFPLLWVNNAGLNGHSTKGHQILVEDALLQLKPDYIVFMLGVNDMFRTDLHRLEKLFLKSETPPLKFWLRDHSEVFALIANFRRLQRARQFGLWHDSHGFPNPPVREMDSVQMQEIHNAETALIESYQRRLLKLISTCQDAGIKPVFITQPMLTGEGFDPVTGGNLENVKVEDYNGLLNWQILQRYNEITRSLARQSGLPCFELADKLPKSTACFYDFTHYTNEGAELISTLLLNDFKEMLAADDASY